MSQITGDITFYKTTITVHDQFWFVITHMSLVGDRRLKIVLSYMCHIQIIIK